VEWESIKPNELKEVLRDLSSDWWLAGGHAIDLWLGENTRKHGDIDITLFRENFSDLFNLTRELYFFVASKGGLRRLESLDDLRGKDWNIWVKRKGQEKWLFQCLISDEIDGEWIYRRDHRVRLDKNKFGIVTSLEEAIIAPEIQLLFKSSSKEQKDEVDFNNCLPKLSSRQKKWLKDNMSIIYNNSHSWIERL
jgi:hypothetical protein